MITETTITDDSESAALGIEGYYLLVMSPEAFFSQPLPVSGAVTVGRSSKCDVRVEDPLASREHARVHVLSTASVLALAIEDCGSANGTRVRDAAVEPGQRVPILLGEAVMIGSTVLTVLKGRLSLGPRRVWSHADFENRVESECQRATATPRSTFALARVRFTGAAPWPKVLPILARELPPPHAFAAYGPKDYELLFVDVKDAEAEVMLAALTETCRTAGLEGQSGIAWYPRDGRTGDALLGQANARLKRPPGRPEGVEGAPVEVVPEMQRVREMAARAASSSINVLILGETGVGKEVLARLVHRTSPRAAKPFVALNCAGLAESLIESELFGHEKGAFTGAGAAKVGLIESANGGTVFLDEIGEMPLAMQARLLRVIEAREVLPVGAVRARPIDVRFVSATNRDLDAAVAEGEFRRDLVFRLNGITLQVPPLRERTDEIPALVDTFIAGWCAESGRRDPPLVGQQALDYLLGYPWPGNIRELRNVVERALVLCDGPEILPQHLPLEKIRPIPDDGITFSSPPGGPTGPTGRATPPESRAALQSLPPLGDPKKQAERKRIIDALEACASNQTRAALLLGMSRRTLVSKLGYYGIPRPQKGPHRDGGSGQDGEHP